MQDSDLFYSIDFVKGPFMFLAGLEKRFNLSERLYEFEFDDHDDDDDDDELDPKREANEYHMSIHSKRLTESVNPKKEVSLEEYTSDFSLHVGLICLFYLCRKWRLFLGIY